MSFQRALEKVYELHIGKDELIDPFKLYSRLSDYCSSEYEDKMMLDSYLKIMNRVNMMNIVLNGNEKYFNSAIKDNYSYVKDVSFELYKELFIMTIRLKYKDFLYDDTNIAKPQAKREGLRVGTILYYTPGSKEYHLSSYCPRLSGAKDIYYNALRSGEVVCLCEKCLSERPKLEHVRLSKEERVKAWLNFGERKEGIPIRLNGKNLSKRMIVEKIIGGHGNEI